MLSVILREELSPPIDPLANFHTAHKERALRLLLYALAPPPTACAPCCCIEGLRRLGGTGYLRRHRSSCHASTPFSYSSSQRGCELAVLTSGSHQEWAILTSHELASMSALGTSTRRRPTLARICTGTSRSGIGGRGRGRWP